MENIVMLPCFSSYSYTNNYGFNEVMPDSPSQISSNLIAYDDSFGMYSQFGVQTTMASRSPDTFLVSGSTSMIPQQNLEDSFQGEAHQNFMHLQEDIFYQPWNDITAQQTNNEIQLIPNATKRLINTATNEETEDKKRPTRFQEKQPKIRKEKVHSVRRSQKLTDKITALQKLVSPYGKTDTASVLLEASISIKALQGQIEELFHTISRQPTTNMIGEKGSDLQSRGLCLVPSVILRELERQSINFLLR